VEGCPASKIKQQTDASFNTHKGKFNGNGEGKWKVMLLGGGKMESDVVGSSVPFTEQKV
jgi:hypothetical protein